jgi:prepilin-type N-terminal cleavage/methylation domain-containing protein
MKMNRQQRRGFTLVELLVVIVIIAALAGLTAPMVIKQRKKADQTEAISNARQIGLALLEFETEYGSFPDASTGATVKTNTETKLELSGNTSNDYFRQLIAADIAQAETMFYCKTAFSKKPDTVMNTSETALGKGEVGYGYIMNGDVAFSAAGSPSRPIIAAPLAFPFADATFDGDLYDGKAVILRMDNSATSVPILKESKKAQLPGGKNLLVAGDGSVWGDASTVNPTMVNPTPK